MACCALDLRLLCYRLNPYIALHHSSFYVLKICVAIVTHVVPPDMVAAVHVKISACRMAGVLADCLKLDTNA